MLPNLENSAGATRLEKVSFPIPKKDNAKECSNCHTIALISHSSEEILKVLQARLQQYMNHELPDVQAGFRKGIGIRDQIANIRWSTEKQGNLRRTISSASLTIPKPLTVSVTTNWKILEKMEVTRPPDLPLEKSVCRSGSNS